MDAKNTTMQKEDDLVADFRLKIKRDEVFALKFQGVPIEQDEIFKSITAFSPTGNPKSLPATQTNLLKYEQHLRSKKRYEEERKVLVLDRARRKAYPSLYRSTPTTPNRMCERSPIRLSESPIKNTSSNSVTSQNQNRNQQEIDADLALKNKQIFYEEGLLSQVSEDVSSLITSSFEKSECSSSSFSQDLTGSPKLAGSIAESPKPDGSSEERNFTLFKPRGATTTGICPYIRSSFKRVD
jgi:hypothetical protein